MKCVKTYHFPIDPEKYPWFDKRTFPVVTRHRLEDKIQFACLRGFPSDEGLTGDISPMKSNALLLNLEETIDMFVNHFKLGKVLWPVYPTLLAKNFKELVDICAREKLYLYDFWGFVPGAKRSDKDIWGEYTIPPEADAYLQEKLGDHFLGYDNGEQDGRFVHSRARLQSTISDSREAQYEVFQRYFEKLNDSMLNHTVTLASLTFVHYFAREGNTIMLGAETAQALPCNNMWYSFIRGAAKQYGLLYYGNASVWNRWGKKHYKYMKREPEVIALWGQSEMGRCAGTSLSLLKKLIYNHWMYGCEILGFENSWLVRQPKKDGDKTNDRQYVIGDDLYTFTPVGDIQQKCVEFVEKHGRAGVMHTPVAMVLDFHAGWVPPRQYYIEDIYKVWGCLPYNTSDHQIHCLIEMLYPGYHNAGFYRDERGFEAPTPYGEIMDILLSDAKQEILKRYPILLITRGVKLNKELKDKLKDYVNAGGIVIAFAGTVKEFNSEKLFGVKALAKQADDSYEAILDNNSTQSKLLVTHRLGQGETRLILHEHGLAQTGEEISATNLPNQPISQPYKLIADIETILANAYNEVQLIKVNNPSLQYLTSIKGNGDYTFMVASSEPQTEGFDILSNVGEIESIEELRTTDNVEALEEFLPLHKAEPKEATQKEGKYTIEPGCIRLFNIKVREPKTAELKESNPQKKEATRYLLMPTYEKTLRRTLLDHPTLLHHFDGFIVSGRYIEELDYTAVKKEAHYLNLQKVDLIIDLSDLINHYPDIALVADIDGRENEAIARIQAIIQKAKEYRCKGIIFAPQKNAEVAYNPQKAIQDFERVMTVINRLCDKHNIKSLMKNRISTPMKPEITAFDTASALAEEIDDIPDTAELLLLSSPKRDFIGHVYPMNLPLYNSQETKLSQWAKIAHTKNIPIALTAQYTNWDEVISDIEWLVPRSSEEFRGV